MQKGLNNGKTLRGRLTLHSSRYKVTDFLVQQK